MPKRVVAKKVGDQYVLVPQGDQQDLARGLWAAGGAIVLMLGLRRRGPGGLLMDALGASMLFRGIQGYHPLVSFLGGGARGRTAGDPHQTPSHRHDWKPGTQVPSDDVDEAAMESFPASDSPAHSASTPPK